MLEKYFNKILKKFGLLLLVITIVISACTNMPLQRHPSQSNLGSKLNPYENPPVCIETRKSINNSRREDCQVTLEDGTQRKFIKLYLNGTHAEIQYAQGYLVAKEFEEGILGGMNSIIEKSLKTGSATGDIFTGFLNTCLTQRLDESVSADFKAKQYELYKGYQKGMESLGKTAKYTYEQMYAGIQSIELSAIAEGVTRRIEANPLNIFEILGMCSQENLAKVLNIQSPSGKVTDDQKKIIADDYIEYIKYQRPSNSSQNTNIIPQVKQNFRKSEPYKWGGCIGFTVPSKDSNSGFIHARNLDINLVNSWGSYPVIYFVNEKDKLKFVSAAAAGMNDPAGIGGTNESGITISLHEMSTTKYASQHSGKTAVPSTRLAQIVLQGAHNIDEAFEIAKKYKNFSAWTIFISDAKTEETAHIEFSGQKINIIKNLAHQAAGQTNHFLASEMKTHAFTYNFNKLLESQSRLSWIRDQLKGNAETHQADVVWTIDQLSGHTEVVPNTNYKKTKAFGRTAVKSYNVMSTIVIADPSKNRHEYWLTTVDRYPAAHSMFAGFSIDWTQNKLNDIGSYRTQQYKNKPNWEKSLSTYVQARYEYTRILGDNPEKALELINQAIQEAKDDGIEEYTYYFMKARLLHELKRYKEASETWDFLNANKEEFYTYGQALIALYSAATEIELDPEYDKFVETIRRLYPTAKEKTLAASKNLTTYKGNSKYQASITEAINLLRQLKSSYEHFDLDAKLKLAAEIQSNVKRDIDLPTLDWVVVEN